VARPDPYTHKRRQSEKVRYGGPWRVQTPTTHKRRQRARRGEVASGLGAARPDPTTSKKAESEKVRYGVTGCVQTTHNTREGREREGEVWRTGPPRPQPEKARALR
jgi:hypothetical protein